MVAFGDPNLQALDISCSEKGTGRWIDGKNWSYDFDRDLPSGVSCVFRLKKRAQVTCRQVYCHQTSFRFNTGASVITAQPYEGDEYSDEQQRLVYFLDGDPDDTALTQTVYCSIEGIKERVGIRLLTGSEKNDFLKSIGHDKDQAPVTVFDCRQQFPPHARIDIIWGKGVKSKTGIATTKDQKISYKTRTPFSVTFRCMKEDPKANCMPLSPMNLEFSSPVPWNFVRDITLKKEKGQQMKPSKIDYSHAIDTCFFGESLSR